MTLFYFQEIKGVVRRRTSDINYRETLSEVGNRAGSAVEEIYDDLQDHIKYVSAIPPDNRSALATQVEALYNVCNMAGGFCSHSSDCIGILNLSSFCMTQTAKLEKRPIVQQQTSAEAGLEVPWEPKVEPWQELRLVLQFFRESELLLAALLEA